MKKFLALLLILSSSIGLNAAERALALANTQAEVKVAADAAVAQSRIFVVPTMISALLAGERTFFKPNEQWKAVNKEQQWFLDKYYNNAFEGELSQFTKDELLSWASRNYQELNDTLAKNGFDIKLDPFNPKDEFGCVSILKIAPKWLKPGTKTKFYYKDAAYDGVKMKEGFKVFKVGNRKVAQINTKTKDKVYLALADKHNLDNFALAEEIDAIRAGIKQSSDVNTTFLQFPKINIDLTEKFPWLLGMKAPNQGLGIAQAIAQTKLQMDEYGVRLKSAFDGKTMKSPGTPEPFIIDQPFYMWIQREGFNTPIMYAYCNVASWVTHNPNKVDQEIDKADFEEFVDQGRCIKRDIEALIIERANKILSENPNVDDITLFTQVLSGLFDGNKMQDAIDTFAQETAQLIQKFKTEDPRSHVRAYMAYHGRNQAWPHDPRTDRKKLEASGLVFKIIDNHADLMVCTGCGINFRGFEKDFHSLEMIKAFHKTACPKAAKMDENISPLIARNTRSRTPGAANTQAVKIEIKSVLARLQRFLVNYDASKIDNNARNAVTNAVNKLNLLLDTYNDDKDYTLLFNRVLENEHNYGADFIDFGRRKMRQIAAQNQIAAAAMPRAQQAAASQAQPARAAVAPMSQQLTLASLMQQMAVQNASAAAAQAATKPSNNQQQSVAVRAARQTVIEQADYLAEEDFLNLLISGAFKQ